LLPADVIDAAHSWRRGQRVGEQKISAIHDLGNGSGLPDLVEQPLQDRLPPLNVNPEVRSVRAVDLDHRVAECLFQEQQQLLPLFISESEM